MSVDYKVRQIYNVVIKEVTETQESWNQYFALPGRYTDMNLIMFSWYMHKNHMPLWLLTLTHGKR